MDHIWMEQIVAVDTTESHAVHFAKNYNNKSMTENGAVGYKTTTKALLDLNFKVSSLRSQSEEYIVNEFIKALLREYQVQKCTGSNTSVIDGYSGFIFTNAKGTVFEPNAINRAIKRIIKDFNELETELAKAENRDPELLPDFCNHVLRHTFCTRLCENTDNIKVIQTVMGHSDIKTTLDIYAECTADKKQETLQSIAENIIIR